LKAVLIDDDESNLSSLSEKLTKHCPEINIVGQCDNAIKGIEIIDSVHPDIVFLDIEMPVMNGFLMLQQLTYKNFELIFVTAYDHYAIKAIRFSALDYLVKPVEIEELKSAVGRAIAKRNQTPANPQIELLLEHLQKKDTVKIAIPTMEGLQFLNITDIMYLEASSNYTNIFLENRHKLIVSRSLKDFEELLTASIFLRIHHSYIINKNFLEKYIKGEGGQVVLRNGITLDVSKRKKTEFLKAIGH
jgi:two-component system, LytTR family, response regulator